MPCQTWPLDVDIDDHQSYSFVIAVLIMKQKLDNKINESKREREMERMNLSKVVMRELYYIPLALLRNV